MINAFLAYGPSSKGGLMYPYRVLILFVLSKRYSHKLQRKRVKLFWKSKDSNENNLEASFKTDWPTTPSKKIQTPRGGDNR